MARRFALPLCVLLFLAPALAGAAVAPWIAHSALKVRPDDAPSNTDSSVHLWAARNEWEAVQIVVRDDAGGALSGCDVAAGPLAGPGADLTEIELYRESYVMIDHPSQKPADPAVVGWWPDALIPFVDHFYGETRSGAPFDVPEGWNQPIWIDVHVPKDQAAGDYAGQVVVGCGDAAPVSIPMTLTVWGFALPDSITLPSSYGFSSGRVISTHLDMGGGQTPGGELVQMYYKEALLHRFMFNTGWQTGPVWSWDPDTQTGSWDLSALEAEMGPAFDGTLVPGASFDTYRMPYPSDSWPHEEQVAFWRELAAAFREKGWFDKLFLYLPDEPTPAEYPELVQLSALLHEADPALPALATEQITAGLIGSVNIWCPDEPLFSDALPVPPFPEDYPPRQAQGEKVWWYNCTSAQVAFDFSNHFVDNQGMYLRIWPWLTRRYNFNGLLYWETVDLYGEVDDPWTDQYQPQFLCNGDGTLFYPGVPAKIGGTHDIPVSSMRMKELREGMEDYEYFAILDGMGLSDFVQAEVESRAWKSYQWEHDPGGIEESRHRLAEMILGELDTDPPAAPTGLDATTWATGVSLTWNAVDATDLAGYEVSLARYPGERIVAATVAGGTTHANFDGLEEWKPVYLTVRAFDQAGNRGAWADEVAATPQPAASGDDAGENAASTGGGYAGHGGGCE